MTSTTFSPSENDAYVGPHITGPGYVSSVLSDGTIRTEAVGFDMSPITVDGFLRGQQRAHVTRMLRQMSEELGIVDLVFPRPIMERIAARAVIRRAGRSRRGYRGAHHRGTYTVAVRTPSPTSSGTWPPTPTPCARITADRCGAGRTGHICRRLTGLY